MRYSNHRPGFSYINISDWGGGGAGNMPGLLNFRMHSHLLTQALQKMGQDFSWGLCVGGMF